MWIRRSFALRASLLVALASSAALVAGRPAAAQDVTSVHVLEVEGAIDRPLQAYLDERLTEAEDAGAIVVLQLDTPGSLGQDGLALAERVARMDVPVIAWVGPAPARASGAGALLMLAASTAAVAPGSQTGPLRPLDVLDPEPLPPNLRHRIAGWLASRGRTVDLDALDEPMNAQEAIDTGVARVAGYTVPEILDGLDGTTVRTASGDVALHTRIATTTAQAREHTVELRFEEPGLIDRILHAVSTPTTAYVLLLLALAALAFEITQPGFGFAGFSGLVLLALAAYGLSVATPSWPWFAPLLAGEILLVLDVRLRALSWPTWVGLVAFGVGSAMAWSGAASIVRPGPWLIGAAVVGTILYYGFGLTVAIQSRDRIVRAQRGLIGLVGEARGRLAPDGPVFVKGALWRGRALGDPIDAGAPVRVRGVDGLILRVEVESPEPGSPPA